MKNEILIQRDLDLDNLTNKEQQEKLEIESYSFEKLTKMIETIVDEWDY